MTDKEIEGKKKVFIELFCIENEYSNCGYWWKSGEGLEVHLDISSPEKVWQWISRLVEEVEDRDRKLLEEVANSDYELGKMQGIIEAKEHEQHRKKIRKELLRRYN